jgi:hypothetical protein
MEPTKKFGQSFEPMPYTPKHLKRWTRPDCYIGATWEEFFVFLSQHRDSDCLTQSNFACGLEAIKAVASKEPIPDEGATVHIVSENHWAVGWVEWIAIHESDTAALELADKLTAVYDRIKDIRKHRSEFYFTSFADMLTQVRGNYFTGDPSRIL